MERVLGFVLGSVLLVAGGSKALDPGPTRQSLEWAFGPAAPGLTALLVAAEVGVGLLLLTGLGRWIATLSAALLGGAFFVWVSSVAVLAPESSCGCGLGAGDGTGPAEVARAGSFAATALVLLWFRRSADVPGAGARDDGRGPEQVAASDVENREHNEYVSDRCTRGRRH